MDSADAKEFQMFKEFMALKAAATAATVPAKEIVQQEDPQDTDSTGEPSKNRIWMEFWQKVRGIIGNGIMAKVAMKFASTLRAKKEMSLWTDSEIQEQYVIWKKENVVEEKPSEPKPKDKKVKAKPEAAEAAPAPAPVPEAAPAPAPAPVPEAAPEAAPKERKEKITR
jgi:hypothetical protein